MREHNKPKFTKKRKIIVGSLWGFVLFLIIVIIASNASSPKAKYQASSTGITVINPATVGVSFKVTNIGKASGTPTCTIDVQDPSSVYTGADMAQLSDKLNPGQTVTSAGSIVVTKQGAQYVTSAKVTCN